MKTQQTHRYGIPLDALRELKRNIAVDPNTEHYSCLLLEDYADAATRKTWEYMYKPQVPDIGSCWLRCSIRAGDPRAAWNTPERNRLRSRMASAVLSGKPRNIQKVRNEIHENYRLWAISQNW